MVQEEQGQKKKFAALAVCLFVSVYPLFLMRGYLDVLEAKFLLLKGIMIFTVGGIFLVQITVFFQQENKKQFLIGKVTEFVRSMSLTDKAVLGMNASFWISFALSSDKYKAWTGIEASGSGMFYYQLMFLLYFIISRYYVPAKREINWWFLSTIVLTTYALIQFLGFDFLHLFPKGEQGIVTDFLSFLGNTGVYAFYIALVLPSAMYFCCMADNENTSPKEKLLFYITFYMCCLGILCGNCDAAYLGFATGYAGIAIVTAGNTQATRRFWLLTAGMCCCVKLTGALFVLFKSTVRNVSWITSILLETSLLWFVMVVSLALAGLLGTGKIRKYRGFCIAVAGLSVFALAGSFFWFSVVDRITPLGRLENYLRFSDSWGTERGYIFSRLLHVFKESNILHKVFGWGSGMTFSVIQANFWEEMCERFVYVYDDAHSQWITLLMTTGISGCIWMVTALASEIVRVFKKGRESLWAVLLIVYLVVSSVSITQPVTGPYLWLGLGVAEASVKCYNQCHKSCKEERET